MKMTIRSKDYMKEEWIVNNNGVIEQINNTQELFKKIYQVLQDNFGNLDELPTYAIEDEKKEFRGIYTYNFKRDKIDYVSEEEIEEVGRGYITLEKYDDTTVKLTLVDIRLDISEYIGTRGISLIKFTYFIHANEVVNFIKNLLYCLLI